MTSGEDTAIRTTRFRLPIVGIALAIAASSTPVVAATAPVDAGRPDRTAADDGSQQGNASYYAKHLAGRRTASGERYDPAALTAAHRSLPLGTRLRVTNPKNDKSVVVTVNDRGRLPKNRVVDVSSAAADALDMKKSGVTRVETRVEPRDEKRAEKRAETRVETRVEKPVEPRVEPPVEPRDEKRAETRAAKRAATRAEKPVEPRVEPRVEKRAGTRAEPRAVGDSDAAADADRTTDAPR